MDERLVERFRGITEEEERLLRGEPLSQKLYTTGKAFVIQGDRFVLPRRLITMRPHTRFCAFPMHSHDFVEMTYMISGRTGHHMADGGAITLEAGELLLINRRSAHSIDYSGEGDLGVNFIIQPKFFDFVPSLIGAHNVLGSFLLDSLRSVDGATPYLHFRVAQRHEIQTLIESIITTLCTQPLPGLHLLRTEMGLLFLHLLSHPELMEIPTRMGQGDRLLIDLLQAIREQYAAFSLKDFAAEHHVSSAYVCRLLKESTGKTCTALLQERRLGKARQLLEETDLSVQEICNAVGYNNTCYFYHLFKESEGVSPADYRVNTGRTKG